MYAIDADGFPKRLRCDFDKRFIQGAVSRLLRSHGIRVGVSPPHRQSQNGAVEHQWQLACNMARSFLATARLPKRYWFWAIRESVTQMNLLPVRSGPSEYLIEFQEFTPDSVPDSPTTAHFLSSIFALGRQLALQAPHPPACHPLPVVNPAAPLLTAANLRLNDMKSGPSR